MKNSSVNGSDISHFELKSQGCVLMCYENTNFASVVDEKGLMYFFLINTDNSACEPTLLNSPAPILSLSLIDTFQFSCNSEIWAIDACPFIEENDLPQGEDRNHSKYLVVAGSGDGFIYGLRVKFGKKTAELTESDTSKSNNKGSEESELDVDIEELWTQKAGDFITKVEILKERDELKRDESTRLKRNGETNPIKYRALVSSMDKTIRCIDISNGNLIWGQVFLAGVNTFLCYEKAENNRQNKVFDEDIVIAGATDGDLRVFKLSDGEIKFQTKLPANIRTLNINGAVRDNNGEESLKILCGCDDFSMYELKIKPHGSIRSITESDFESEAGETSESNATSKSNTTRKSGKISVFPPSEIEKIKDFPSYIWYTTTMLNLDPQINPTIIIHTYSFDYLQGLVEKSETPQIPGVYAYELPMVQNQQFRWVVMDINTQCVTDIFNLGSDTNNKSKIGNCIALGTPLGRVKLLILRDKQDPIIEEIAEVKGMINAITYHKYKSNKYILFTTDTSFLAIKEISSFQIDSNQ